MKCDSSLIDGQILSHGCDMGLAEIYASCIKRLRSQSDLALPIEVTLQLLDELTEFQLGRFLLTNKGLNGFWTSYVILNGILKDQLHPLERWILESSPAFRATRERFYIFQEILNQFLKNNSTLASVPCGLMDDLIHLNSTGISHMTFVGADLDAESIRLAKENGKRLNHVNLRFYQQDAWNLKLNQTLDCISSNGLNIYEPNDERVVLLYKKFYQCLNENGMLVTSFLTPPPQISQESTWNNYNQEDVIKQKALFGDIIGANWQCYRTENQTRDQLEEVGFKDVAFKYDTQGMFPTVIAWKK